LDALGDLVLNGVLARFPGFCASATPYLCRDRGVLRGAEETEAQVCARLRVWRQTARIKGSPVSVLQQLQAFLTPHNPRIRLVNNTGRYVEIATNGTITVGDQSWNWDGITTLRTRFWVLIWVPALLWQSDGTFGDAGAIGDGGAFGSTASLGIIAGVRHVIREFSSDNSRHMNTVLIFDDTAWNAQQPDGTWNRMSRRNPSANYWVGDR
jgi:hypothetical protein